jgi:peptide/nickel transport system substrate-binding protein
MQQLVAALFGELKNRGTRMNRCIGMLPLVRPRSLRLALWVCVVMITWGCGAPNAAPNPPSASSPAEGRRGGVVRIALWQEPIILNPIIGNQVVNAAVSRTMLEGLLAPRPDGTVVGALATEVPSLANGGVSPDGLTVTWKLRQGVVWSDGRPFTSKDAVFTYHVMMNPTNPVTNLAGYPDIESIATPDDVTLVVKYRVIYSAFKEHFEWILPEHIFGGETAIETKEFNQAPVGTGPFRFKSWEPGNAITLERNASYREAGKPRLDGIIFKMVPARDVAILWFKVGEVEGLWNLAEDNIPEIEAIPDAVLNPAPSNRIERLVLNTSCPAGPQQGDPACRHPVLGDVRVRQAIELAIDKRSIVDELLFGRASVASSILPFGPYAAAMPPTEPNPEKARQLLEEAGWQVGPDGIRVKDGTRASLSYTTTTGDRLRDQTQALVQLQLRTVGIEVRPENVPSPILFGGWQDGAARARGNFDIAMYTISIPLDPQASLHNLYHSSRVPSERVRNGSNVHRILDPELDAALQAASLTVDEAQRAAAYRIVAERVAAGKGHILLYTRLDLDAFRKNLKGHTPNIWSDFTWNTENWSLES